MHFVVFAIFPNELAILYMMNLPKHYKAQASRSCLAALPKLSLSIILCIINLFRKQSKLSV